MSWEGEQLPLPVVPAAANKGTESAGAFRPDILNVRKTPANMASLQFSQTALVLLLLQGRSPRTRCM